MPPIVSIALFVLPVCWLLKKDFQRGFCAALALFTVMPSTLHLEAGGGFELTFQRILLGVVLLFWVPWVMKRPKSVIPFKGLIYAWWAVNLISLFVAVSFGASVKWFLTFSTEIVLFYMIVCTTLTDRASAMAAFHALCITTCILAVLGAIEYYTFVNPALLFFGIEEIKAETDVVVTFRHRILFGYSMAMGFPLLLAWGHRMQGRLKQVLLTVFVMLAIGSCYFSGSRGPWFGAALAGVVMYVLGTSKVRKSMRIFAYLSVVVIIARPGVRDTLVDLCTSTWDPDSYRGRSYYYRKELWPVAKDLVKVDGTRYLFGYGGLSTETMDLHDRFEYGGSTAHTGFSSWDNNYACDLVEFGYAGLLVQCALYGFVLLSLYRSVTRCPEEYRNLAAAFVAAAVVYMFALSNVYMFSPQLKCLFLVVVSVGARLPVLVSQELEAGSEPALDKTIENDEVIAVRPA